MKRSIVSFIFFAFIAMAAVGQGLENFANFPGTGNTYQDGTFAGQDGSTWNYWQCRGDMTITAPTPCLGKGRTPTAEITSGTLQNGCGTLSFDYMQAFSTNVALDVFVNGLLVATVTSNSETGVVKNSGSITVNTPGTFTLDFKQNSNTAGQVSIDNITWTAYSAAPLPEPTNYPTAFTGTPVPYAINLSWVDASGGQVPAAYILLASTQDNIVAPVDGTPIVNDPNLSDGTGALNVNQGVQLASFSNLQSNTPYYFKLFPYTNSGSNINYKTDGTAPALTVTTPNTVTLNSQNFNSYSLAPWTAYNVVGAQLWVIDSIHGVGGSACAKMSGYAGGNFENEDWLISPPMNFNNYINESMVFQSAYKYTGPGLEVMISNDYNGTGDPTLYNWIPLTATWSAGNWVWTSSGQINLSGVSGTAVYIGFRYMSTSTEGSTWELDDIMITGDMPVGIGNPETASNVTVYPNPASGSAVISFGDNLQKRISVVSIVGTEVFSTITEQTNLTLDLSTYARGVYLIKCENLGSKQATVTKLIVK